MIETSSKTTQRVKNVFDDGATIGVFFMMAHFVVRLACFQNAQIIYVATSEHSCQC